MKETWLDKFLMFIGWWTLCRWFEEWIYPGYYLKNLLFKRYDLIRITSMRPYEYAEPDYLMFEANMELIVRFIEKYEPEKHIEWYGEHSHKYGENVDYVMMFPEYKDKFIMDIIKEIYHFYKETLYQTNDDLDYLYYVYHQYIVGEMKFIELENKMFELDFDKTNTIKKLNEFDEKEIYIDWKVIDKYFKKRKDILNDEKFLNKINEIASNLEKDKQKYLHLCIEVRPYLWT